MKTLIRPLVVAFAVLLGLGFGQAQAVALDDALDNVPDNLKAPSGENVILMAHAKGVQIYVCQVSGQSSTWILKAPEADLADESGKVIIHHFAGPTWKHIDGSELTGKVVAKHDAPKADSIPWLLLSASAHNGQGIMARVTSVQRIHTEGGMPPEASKCNADANGKESRSTYAADYYFYGPTPSAQ